MIKRFICRMFSEYDQQSITRQFLDALSLSLPMLLGFCFMEPLLIVLGCFFMVIMVRAKRWYDMKQYKLKILMIQHPGENLKILEEMEK